jgi:hypothetical protein
LIPETANRLAIVSVEFRDPATSQPVRSTELARRVLAAGAKSFPELQQNILGAPNWRTWYLRLYADLAIKESLSVKDTTEVATAGLAEFHSCLVTESGIPLKQAVSEGYDQELVETVEIRGTKPVEKIALEGLTGPMEQSATEWVVDGLAEPGLIESFRYLDQHESLNLGNDLLFAVAGAAEFAPTEHWLCWGGTVAVVARPNPASWQKLISMARNSGGTMLVPVRKNSLTKKASELSDEELAAVAGLDILDHYAEIASWMSSLSAKPKRRFVLGLYAYTPSVNHIRVQGVQESLASVAMERIAASKLALSWLATPTDSAPGPASIGQRALERFGSRRASLILRDSLLGIFNAARPAKPKFYEGANGEKLALIDASVQQQGPSYSFSKRTQRWRAYLAHYSGVKVSYAISPPARTNSVLRHKILRASYRGAPLFGVKPFEVKVAKSAAAAVLARDLNDPTSFANKDTTTELHAFSAVHGGLWGLAYRPRSIWIAATLLGLPALLRKGY